MAKIRLDWTNPNFGAVRHNIYRGTSSLDPQNLPPPLDDVPGGSETFTDDNGIVRGQTYHYIIGTEVDGDEHLSNEVSLLVPVYDRLLTKILMIVNDLGHNSTTNTRNGLIAAGFDPDNITVVAESATPPSGDFDVGLFVRSFQTKTANWAYYAGLWENGMPFFFGSANNHTAGTGRECSSTHANLTGTYSVATGANENLITDNSHPITSPWATGRVTIWTGSNSAYQHVVTSSQPFVGQYLSTGDPDVTSTSSGFGLIAVPAGTERLNSAGPTMAPAVVWGDLYAGQFPYTEDGRELMARSIDWLCGGL